ncbi:hypothetical protein BBJ28_00025568, partial [Nothophytophthora sp. Chile5]
HFTLAADDWSCSPQRVEIDTNDAFYASISALETPIPRFEGHHDYLCDSSLQDTQTWAYCLPISAQLDEDDCSGADRLDLLKPQSPQPRCQASILHLLLVDVYKELRHAGGEPALLFGTLLGAVRDEGLIPYTEDADLGFQLQDDPMPIVRRRLRAKGYHVFVDNIWRVCVAPTHPLASQLYDPELAAPIDRCTGPYLDLYHMTPDLKLPGFWTVERTQRRNASIPEAKIRPYSQVKINGVEFDTVADPVDFLLEEYGASYLKPTQIGKWN